MGKCELVFGDMLCGFDRVAYPDAFCDNTFSSCRRLGNEDRFGGTMDMPKLPTTEETPVQRLYQWSLQTLRLALRYRVVVDRMAVTDYHSPEHTENLMKVLRYRAAMTGKHIVQWQIAHGISHFDDPSLAAAEAVDMAKRLLTRAVEDELSVEERKYYGLAKKPEGSY